MQQHDEERLQSDPIKQREFRFNHLRFDAQVEQAVALLQGFEGIIAVTPLSELELQVTYHLRQLSYQMIEEALVGFGLHLDNSLMEKMKRALYHYLEENERMQLCDSICRESAKQLFIQRYAQLQHGCRDRRPEHWRTYL